MVPHDQLGILMKIKKLQNMSERDARHNQKLCVVIAVTNCHCLAAAFSDFCTAAAGCCYLATVVNIRTLFFPFSFQSLALVYVQKITTCLLIYMSVCSVEMIEEYILFASFLMS
jgi:hypothetical protein